MNNRALKAVREQRKLDLSEVALSTTISQQRLDAFEAGAREPSRKQIEKLAEVYGVPLYALMSGALPNLIELPTDFRQQTPGPADLSPAGLKVFWAAERISRFTHELRAELDFIPKNLNGVALAGDTLQQKASKLRSVFDDWFEPRARELAFSGSDEQKFLAGLRLFFEVQGLITNINDAPPTDFYGFYAKPEAGERLVFVNRKVSSRKAQLFTFVHEIGHAVFDEAGISNPFALRNEVERSCNKFAAEFLAPIEQFRHTAEGTPKRIRRTLSDFIDVVSARTLLSKHATAIRLVEADLITQKELRGWERIWIRTPRAEKDEEKAEAASNSVGGVPHAKRLSEVGTLSVFLAAQAVRSGLIDSHDVVTGLRLSETLQERAYSLAERRMKIAMRP